MIIGKLPFTSAIERWRISSPDIDALIKNGNTNDLIDVLISIAGHSWSEQGITQEDLHMYMEELVDAQASLAGGTYDTTVLSDILYRTAIGLAQYVRLPPNYTITGIRHIDYHLADLSIIDPDMPY